MQFSIIVTSYNYEKYIRQTLDSLVNQTYKDFEVIIIDDGSKDNSIEIIKEYVQKYSNFNLYTHDGNVNKGLIESVKLGISKATGDFIAFLESDDYWSLDYLQEKADYITNHPEAKIIINDIQTFGGTFCDDYVAEQAKFYRKHKNKKNYFDRLYSGNQAIATFSEVCVEQNVLRNLDFNTPVSAWLDWWLWRQAAICYPISFIDKKLTFWNRHDGSYISTTFNDSNKYAKSFKKASNHLLLKKYPIEYILFKMKRLFKICIQNIFSLTNSCDESYKILKILGCKFRINNTLKTKDNIDELLEKKDAI